MLFSVQVHIWDIYRFVMFIFYFSKHRLIFLQNKRVDHICVLVASSSDIREIPCDVCYTAMDAIGISVGRSST